VHPPSAIAAQVIPNIAPNAALADTALANLRFMLFLGPPQGSDAPGGAGQSIAVRAFAKARSARVAP